MKNCKIHIILFLLLIISAGKSFAVCYANFEFSEVNPLQVQFQNTSESYNEGNVHYYWDFGDGVNSFEENPFHVYNAPGIYTVGLTIITSNLCYSQKIKEIYIGIPPNSPQCFLQIEFETVNATAPDYNNGTALVYGFSDVPCCYYAFWSNGDEGEIVDNLSPGTYCVTLTNGEECYGTSCVTIGYNNNCSASFFIDSTTFGHLDGAYRFINNSHGEENYYLWDFGDGITSNEFNPLHVYSDTGTYNVCLSIYTYYGCSNTTCKELYVNYIAPPTASINGNVYAGESLLPEGIAVLFEVNGENYDAIDYVLIEDGHYRFDSLPKDKLYQTHLIPYFDVGEIYFPKYSPVYSDNSVYWQDADFINLYEDTVYDSHLYTYDEIFLDNGMISGSVKYLFEEAYEQEIYGRNWFETLTINDGFAANMVVLLKTSFKEVIDFRLTDGNGYFEFNNLEYGSYYLSVEKPGFESDEILITISESEPQIVNSDFSIQQTTITPIESETVVSSDFIYPNPAKDVINVNITEPETRIDIYNIEGKLVFSESANYTPLAIPLADMVPGMYIVQVSSAYSCKRVKITIE
jgi:PKD repeat protein